MHIPSYWAEQCIETVHQGKVRQIHRFGWSDVSQAQAQQHAISRCQDALDTLQHTGKIRRVDALNNYSLPIREQVLQRYDDGSVLTVNSYGASCLNVPNVMILDVDNDDILTHLSKHNKKPKPTGLYWAIAWAVLACVLLGQFIRLNYAVGLFVPIMLAMVYVLLWLDDKREKYWQKRVLAKVGGYEAFISTRLNNFTQSTDTSFRLYATPDGFRLIATDRPYLPSDEMVAHCFDALLVDERYAHLCQTQDCFRARVTGKPWRMDMDDMKKLPTKQFWQDSELTDFRQMWLAQYHDKAQNYRACRFIASFGTQTDAKVMALVARHDKLCQSERDLPVA